MKRAQWRARRAEGHEPGSKSERATARYRANPPSVSSANASAVAAGLACALAVAFGAGLLVGAAVF